MISNCRNFKSKNDHKNNIWQNKNRQKYRRLSNFAAHFDNRTVVKFTTKIGCHNLFTTYKKLSKTMHTSAFRMPFKP